MFSTYNLNWRFEIFIFFIIILMKVVFYNFLFESQSARERVISLFKVNSSYNFIRFEQILEKIKVQTFQLIFDFNVCMYIDIFCKLK